MNPDATDKPSLPLPRLLRAPLVLVGFVLSLYAVGIILAWVSVGSWIEAALSGLGFKRLGGVSAVGGTLGFTLLGVIGPAWLGYRLVGWPGLIAGPLLLLAAVGLLDRW